MVTAWRTIGRTEKRIELQRAGEIWGEGGTHQLACAGIVDVSCQIPSAPVADEAALSTTAHGQRASSRSLFNEMDETDRNEVVDRAVVVKLMVPASQCCQ